MTAFMVSHPMPLFLLLSCALLACRTGDLSADLCRTITHLVQADSTSLLAAYRSSPVPLPGQQQFAAAAAAAAAELGIVWPSGF
jgi:hypothetical protein